MLCDFHSLLPPCTYQGGKQRLASKIVTMILSENEVTETTIFYDLCCGSGAISLELVNQGIAPQNIHMVDIGGWGLFWQSIAENTFDLTIFEEELNKLGDVSEIQQYLETLGSRPIDAILKVYHYLMLQAGAFGGKQIMIKGNEWKNTTFRSYWKPTETSNRRSCVNPMMPLPQTMKERVQNIVSVLGGKVCAKQADVFSIVDEINTLDKTKVIVYIDPPYLETTGYATTFDVKQLIESINLKCPIYISEKRVIEGAEKSILLDSGRSKGNISGKVKKKPIEEWLNKF